jgi:hypothetical protein
VFSLSKPKQKVKENRVVWQLLFGEGGNLETMVRVNVDFKLLCLEVGEWYYAEGQIN